MQFIFAFSPNSSNFDKGVSLIYYTFLLIIIYIIQLFLVIHEMILHAILFENFISTLG